ncbi:CotH kinase family protein [Myxococcota bacterium]|nr:CotH kinase family protein [Myxococcota bacterium]
MLLLIVAACAGQPATKDSLALTDSETPPAESETALDTELPAGPGAVRINEVVSANRESLNDGDGDSSDWIELYNDSDEAVSLAGWGLSDDPDDPFAWTFPDITLAARGFLVVFASGKDTAGPAGELHTSFKLSAEGELLSLTRSDGAPSDTLTIPALDDDQSYGLDEPITTAALLGPGSAARALGEPAGDWTLATFDDSAWTAVTLPVGFDGTVSGGVPGEVANGATATQSTDGYGFFGSAAVDGDPSTFSHTADADLLPWWQVDLGANYAITRVELVNRFDCCAERLYNIVISVLDADGEPVWASELLNPTLEGESPTSPGRVLAVDLSAYGTSVRVDKTAVNGALSSEWLSLAEVAVTGTLASPYAGILQSDVGGLMTGTRLGVRAGFTLEEAAPTRLRLDIAYDDGFTAWIDGEPFVSGNPGAPIAHDGTPSEASFVPGAALGAGAHTLALLGENVSADDDDLLLDPTLTAEWFTPGAPAFFSVPTPGAPNGAGSAGSNETPTFVPPRGFVDSAQDVVITCPTPGATLLTTTNGASPTADNATITPAASADAFATLTVPISTTATLRALCTREGWTDSPVATHSYLVLADVVRQPAAPAGFPAVWSSQAEGDWLADYEMDPEVVNDPATQRELLEGLREIPTLSIVTDVDDLFGEDGIYSNSASRGEQWERRVSLELILPDGSTGFAEDASLQIHGYGWRYHGSTLKHSFRVSFQAEYGASKLDYPWFADSPVDRFDSIVLRAGGSKTWLDFRDPAAAQYLHDAFARDTARDMGVIDGHATYVHLYLNGLYWGLYMPVERPDAGFAEEYYGGDDADYDAINRRTTTNEAIDGDLEAYNTMLALADADLSDDANVAALEQYLDIDGLIDWMLIHQYMSNYDGPCCFEGNNQRGIRRREAGAQYHFYVWDMEYSLWTADAAVNVEIDVAGHASHLYARLRDNAAFRARYAARARELLTGDGALTPAAAAARYEARADEIYSALLAESARWGDTYRAVPYTRDVEWQTEYDRLMRDYFPHRTQSLIDQLTAAGLYTP